MRQVSSFPQRSNDVTRCRSDGIFSILSQSGQDTDSSTQLINCLRRFSPKSKDSLTFKASTGFARKKSLICLFRTLIGSRLVAQKSAGALPVKPAIRRLASPLEQDSRPPDKAAAPTNKDTTKTASRNTEKNKTTDEKKTFLRYWSPTLFNSAFIPSMQSSIPVCSSTTHHGISERPPIRGGSLPDRRATIIAARSISRWIFSRLSSLDNAGSICSGISIITGKL